MVPETIDIMAQMVRPPTADGPPGTWKLDLRKYFDGKHLLLLTIPQCGACSRMQSIIAEAQMATGCFVYKLEMDGSDPDCLQLNKELGAVYPYVCVVNSRGVLRSIVPHFVAATPTDPTGVERVTATKLIEWIS